MMFFVSGILGLIIPLFVIGAVLYLVLRRRNDREGISASQGLLMVYFYTIISATIITAAVGAGYLLSAAFGSAYNDRPIADELTAGITMLCTGVIICVLHVLGKRFVESREGKTTPLLKRVYLFIMLGVFSLGGVVSVPLAIYETAHYYVEGSNSWSDPSGSIAAAVVILPLWIYYLTRVMRETRAANKDQSSDDVAGGVV
jgi:heme/copper-type cytochrome/quinol oxidase subunit 1